MSNGKPFELKASDAKQLANNSIKNSEQILISQCLSKIQDKIQEYASEGHYQLEYDLSSHTFISSSVLTSIINILKNYGYEVQHEAKRNSIVSQALYISDTEYSDILTIKWFK